MDATETEAVADMTGVERLPGNVVLVRTSNGVQGPEAYLRRPGLGAAARRWRADRRPLAA